MERRMTATEARVHFGEVLREVFENESRVVIERSGKAQAVVISLAEYERLRNGRSPLAEWMERADRAAARIQREMNGRPMPDIDELIDGGREERDDAIIASLYRR